MASDPVAAAPVGRSDPGRDPDARSGSPELPVVSRINVGPDQVDDASGAWAGPSTSSPAAAAPAAPVAVGAVIVTWAGMGAGSGAALVGEVLVGEVLGRLRALEQIAMASPGSVVGAEAAMWRRLVEGHHRGGDGDRCRVCRSALGMGRVWPCGVWLAARANLIRLELVVARAAVPESGGLDDSGGDAPGVRPGLSLVVRGVVMADTGQARGVSGGAELELAARIEAGHLSAAERREVAALVMLCAAATRGCQADAEGQILVTAPWAPVAVQVLHLLVTQQMLPALCVADQPPRVNPVVWVGMALGAIVWLVVFGWLITVGLLVVCVVLVSLSVDWWL
ncbi:MAG: hypothetical protein ACRDTG_29065 [Pseudonocardiaceae bacterium]